MKKLIVILIACSFYLPETTQIIDFSQCVFSLFTSSSGEICDCMINSGIAPNAFQNKESIPHNHKHIEVKLVDKICTTASYIFLPQSTELLTIKHELYTPLFSEEHLQKIFRPPIKNAA